jgi:peptidoglycan hydrolase-like protein with peptidoglycan-binding domain
MQVASMVLSRGFLMHTLVLAFAVCSLFFSFALPVRAAALTDSQVQAILGLLSSFNTDAEVVRTVESALRGGTPGAGSVVAPLAQSGAGACVALVRSLSRGAQDTTTGGEVSKLQQFLAQYPAVYPEGLVTGYFGEATERAVARWQQQKGLSSNDPSGLGLVGPRTRAALACLQAPAEPTTVDTTAPAPTPYAQATYVPLPKTEPVPTPQPAAQTNTAAKPVITVTTSPLHFTVVRPTFEGTATVVDTLKMAVADGRGMEFATSFSDLVKVVNGRWNFTVPLSLKNGEWSLIVYTPTENLHHATPFIFTVQTNTQFGTYIGYRKDGSMFIKTEGIPRADALANCELNASQNNQQYRCTWNGEEIFNNIVGEYVAPAEPTPPPPPPAPVVDRSLDLKINGSDGPVALINNQQITISWSSVGYTTCHIYGVRETANAQYANIQNIGLSGERQVYAYVPGPSGTTVRLRCLDMSGPSPVTTDDTVVVTAASAFVPSSNVAAVGSLAAAVITAPFNHAVETLGSFFYALGIGR